MINPDELILVSVDDHICEPRDMFDAHVPAKYRDQAPRVVEEDDGVEQWWYGDLRGRNIGLNAAAGKSREYFNLDASRYDEMRPGLLRRPRAGARHERGRAARGAQLPELDRLRRAGAEPGPRPRREPGDDPGVQRLARRRVVRRVPRSVHPLRHPPDVGRGARGRGDPPPLGQGCARGHVLGEPRGAADAVDPHRLLGSGVHGGVRHRDGAVLPRRFVVARRAGVVGCAAERDDGVGCGVGARDVRRADLGDVLGAVPDVEVLVDRG